MRDNAVQSCYCMWLIQTHDKSSTSRRPNIRSPNPCEINGVQYFSLGSTFSILGPCNVSSGWDPAVYHNHNQSELSGKPDEIQCVIIFFISSSSVLFLFFIHLVRSSLSNNIEFSCISFTQMADI